MSLNFRVCRLCNSFMDTHPEQTDWLKCPSCGFSKVSVQIITLESYLMGRETKYPEEFNEEIRLNAIILLEKVNALLNELKIKSVEVSSGWRPAGINAAIKNASKKSLHMIGKAIDLKDDKDQKIASLILSNPMLLKKYDLWLEDPAHTKGQNTNWVHLDIGIRKERDLRMFKP